MRKSIQLNVPKPCHESWDQMTPVEKGRFCGSCQKQVVDFTNMSDEQLVLFFKKRLQSSSKNSSVCGRFMHDQLDRTIDIPKKPIPLIKYFFQFLLPGFLMSCGGKTMGKIKVNELKNEVVTESTITQTMGLVMPELAITALPDTDTAIVGTTIVLDEADDCNNVSDTQLVEGLVTVHDTSILKITEVQGDDAMTVIGKVSKDINITGKVIDDNGQPISYASVFVKGTSIGVAVDSAGNFSFKYWATEDSIVLIGSCVGFENKESVVRLNKMEEAITISLNEENMLGEVMVNPSHQTFFVGAVSVVKKKNIIDTICSFLPTKQSLKLYPNPLKGGASLTIEMSKAKTGTYLVQLAAINGQVVLSKEKWMDKNNHVTTLDVPTVTAGTYLVSMINKQSGKTATGKIIVE